MKPLHFFLGLLLTAVAAALAGCATSMPLSSDPPGATVTLNGLPAGMTPTEVHWDNGQDNQVRFQAPGYFPEELNIPRGSGQKQVVVQLSPVSQVRTYDFTSRPQGAAVLIDGARVGTTPARLQVTYRRASRDEPWQERRLSFTLPGYQTETYRLSENIPSIGTVPLTPLRADREYRVTARTRAGAELKADVLLDGRMMGTTPLDLPLVFARSNKAQPWPSYRLSVDVPGQYKAEQAVIEVGQAPEIAFTLTPIAEIPSTLVAPGPVMTPTGISWTMTERKTLAILDTREASEAVADLKPVTNFSRIDLKSSVRSRSTSINSFTVSPDGHNIIFSLTSRDQDGNVYCNLYVKRADGAAGGISQLTQGTRYLDTMPKIANDGSNYLVFTSNRGDRLKPDIFRTNYLDNSLTGGLARLTNDSRFNFAPTYGEANRQLFYLSVEPNFPLAETQLSSIRINGSLPTQMSVTALQVDNSVPDKVYYVKLDDDTKKMQIYSIQADGKLETALINQEYFRASNCFDPAPSPDGGSRIAFVSDAGVDDQLRHNCDLYLMNADGSGVERLTQNGSDDIKPAWSPSEDGVIYFLSNRGGAYNIWRMKLRAGSNPPAR